MNKNALDNIDLTIEEGRHEDLIKEKGIYNKFINERKEAVSWKI